MSVGRICVREVDVIGEKESAQTAARRMHSRKVGTLVVVDEESRPVGIVTDRDLTVRILAPGLDAGHVAVGKVMTHCPETVYADTSIEDALRRMRGGAFRRAPVVDDDGRLVGLLSLDDILELLAEEFAEIGRLIHEEEPSSLGRTD